MYTISKTYLSEYRSNISMPLKEIDIFLKTEKSPYNKEKISELLGISPKELKTIMDKNSLSAITPTSLPVIMKNGSSELCRAFKRELEYGLTELYSPEQISYIYSLDIDAVLNAYATLGVYKLHRGLLETLFNNLYI